MAEYYINDYARERIIKLQDSAFEKRFSKLVVLLNELEGRDEYKKLESVNDFFNQTMYMTDIKNWGVSDYWANTTEFLQKDRADCEDYVFAKFFALEKLGIDPEKLKTFYVKSLRYNVAHMVLAYYETESSEPLILDNYNFKILKASQRTDLQPTKLFDTQKLIIAKYKLMGLVVPNGNDEALKWLEFIQGIRRK